MQENSEKKIKYTYPFVVLDWSVAGIDTGLVVAEAVLAAEENIVLVAAEDIGLAVEDIGLKFEKTGLVVENIDLIAERVFQTLYSCINDPQKPKYLNLTPNKVGASNCSRPQTQQKQCRVSYLWLFHNHMNISDLLYLKTLNS